MPTPRTQGGKGASTPERQPEGPPPAGMHDHSWTLQAVMEMQKDLGKLGEKIDGMRRDLTDLKGDAKETRDKVIEVEKSISVFKGAKLALGGMSAVLLVILGAFLGHVFGK